MGEKRAYKSRKPGGGRKKLKPEYDAGKNLEEQMESAVVLYEEECSLRSIADALTLNLIKVRKLLITAGVYESDVAEKVQDTLGEYRETQNYKETILSTANTLQLSKASVTSYLPYQKDMYFPSNPVRLAEKMRASGTAKRKEAFTTAEVAHLMKVLPDDRMGLSIRLLLGTGMRMQELLALEPQFIEEDGSVIHIRQAVKVVKGTVSIGSPKSKDSIRDIPVPLNVRPCAIKLRDTTDQFIWESPKTGLPCNPTHFRDVFRKSLEEAGDVRLLTPHSCRHTYVSQMQALGVDIQTIQSIVGHADTEMTEHYLHVQESIRQSAIQLFSEAFSA